MTVVIGAPDWGEAIQNEVVAVNQNINAFPTTLTLDVARWYASIIYLAGTIGAAATVTVTAQWSDIVGTNVLTNQITLALLPANGAFLFFNVMHLGTQLKLTFTGGTGTIGVLVTHTNRPAVTQRAPLSPNMAGTTIVSAFDVLAGGGFTDHTVRGTGGAESSTAQGYVGPAILSVRGSLGGAAGAALLDVNGNEIGEVNGPGGGGLAANASQLVQVPPTQYKLRTLNGPTAQTVIAALIAA